MVNPDQPTGPLSRGLRLGRLGASLAGSYLGYQIQGLFLDKESRTAKREEWNEAGARKLRKELETLRGPMMKFGQILSMQSHTISGPALQELSRLQMRAPGMHPTLARAQFKSSMGKPPEALFAEFEDVPFAAASLGQVHRARTTDGVSVAVKIQYPAIREAIENDFKLLKSSALPGRLTGYFPGAILDEIRRGFMDETDYTKEARNIELFHGGLASLDFMAVPRVHWKLTTDRVLTMSLLPGTPLGAYLAEKPSQTARNLIGARLLQLYQYQLYEMHTLHADPHPGNYLIDRDGRIGLVDFGCVKRLSPSIPELAVCFKDRLWERGEADKRRMLELIWGPGNHIAHPNTHALFDQITTFYNTVYPPGKNGTGVVDFGDSKVLDALAVNMRKALQYKLTNPEFAFSTRAELGLYNLLHQIGAQVNTGQTMARTAALMTAKPAREPNRSKVRGPTGARPTQEQRK